MPKIVYKPKGVPEGKFIIYKCKTVRRYKFVDVYPG